MREKKVWVMLLAISVKARYEDKVSKPLEEVELEEGDEVEISIVPKVKKLLKSKVTKTRSSKGYGGGNLFEWHFKKIWD